MALRRAILWEKRQGGVLAGVLSNDEIGPLGVFIARLKVWGWGSFPLFQGNLRRRGGSMRKVRQNAGAKLDFANVTLP